MQGETFDSSDATHKRQRTQMIFHACRTTFLKGTQNSPIAIRDRARVQYIDLMVPRLPKGAEKELQRVGEGGIVQIAACWKKHMQNH